MTAPVRSKAPAHFMPSSRGYIRHWLVKGPSEKPYRGPVGPEHVLRWQALDHEVPLPVTEAKADGMWRLHDPGRNEFVEFSRFYRELTVVEWWAFTTINVEKSGPVEMLLWAAGAVDLWVNDEPIARLNVTRYQNPDSQIVSLPLIAGKNRLCVRLQCLGVRDTRILFGLNPLSTSGITILVPGISRAVQSLAWLDGVKARGNSGLVAEQPAPESVNVVAETGQTWIWPPHTVELLFGEHRPNSVSLEAAVEDAVYKRGFEFSQSQPPSPNLLGGREAHLRFVAKAGLNGEATVGWHAKILPVFARRLLGESSEQDAAAFGEALALVEGRNDCADFALAALLRMAKLGLLNGSELAAIRRVALGFRYWTDESGQDAMCFHSENHSLLFHGCQMLAGQLYPEEVFSASGRTGNEQSVLALGRIAAWLEKIEARGFEEFNSGTYMPITIGAMLNVVDFCEDEKVASRMSVQIDRIFQGLAKHAFGGGIVSSQGRVYRDVLYPEFSGVQALLAFATETATADLLGPRPRRERSGDWVVFPASSRRYRFPADLADLMGKPCTESYRHADVQIHLEKTPAYILTSLAVPATPRDGEHPECDLRPGGAGYQQHLWQASLGSDCHIFANHPGGYFDGTLSRPGYWNGNGVLPRVRQEGRWLQAIYVIPDGSKTHPPRTREAWEWPAASSVRPFDRYPIPFVHLHWPTDAFDRELKRGNWLFGQKGAGMIGVWCSMPVEPHDEVLTGREFRANGYISAWVAVCGDMERDGSLEAFISECEFRRPLFDCATLALSMAGETATRWWERSEDMPK